jgi:hypothetical protein
LSYLGVELMHPKRLFSSLALAAILVACGRPHVTVTPTPTQQVGDDPSTSTTPDSSSIDPDAAWLAYTYETSVSINYPPSWSPELTANGAVFVSPEGSRILWEIYPRPLSERALADPNEWVPNEGGYEIHWSRRVTVPAAEGLEFIWGVQQGDAWDLTPQLIAVLYSVERELDIRLSTFFNSESIEALDELGPEHAISIHFVEFEQMLRTIQIALD